MTRVFLTHFWATVCKNGSPCAIGPLSVCPICLWRWCRPISQTVGRIKMKLDMEVGLGPATLC